MPVDIKESSQSKQASKDAEENRKGLFVNVLNGALSSISNVMGGFNDAFSKLNTTFSINKLLNILLIGLGLGLAYMLTRSVMKK